MEKKGRLNITFQQIFCNIELCLLYRDVQERAVQVWSFWLESIKPGALHISVCGARLSGSTWVSGRVELHPHWTPGRKSREAHVPGAFLAGVYLLFHTALPLPLRSPPAVSAAHPIAFLGHFAALGDIIVPLSSASFICFSITRYDFGIWVCCWHLPILELRDKVLRFLVIFTFTDIYSVCTILGHPFCPCCQVQLAQGRFQLIITRSQSAPYLTRRFCLQL